MKGTRESAIGIRLVRKGQTTMRHHWREPDEEGNMLFHFIRNLRRDCSGYGLIELALLAPQLTILAYYAFDL